RTGTVRAATVSRALVVRVGAPPDDARPADRILGDAADDGRTPVLRRRRDRVRRGRAPLRGAGPVPATRQHLPRLRGPGTGSGSLTHPSDPDEQFSTLTGNEVMN